MAPRAPGSMPSGRRSSGQPQVAVDAAQVARRGDRRQAQAVFADEVIGDPLDVLRGDRRDLGEGLVDGQHALVLDDEEGPLIALIVAAEAAAARGRPTEARRLAAKALAAADGRIDQLFAGMRRSPAWPPDPAAPPPSPTTMFDPPPGTTPRTTRPTRSAERVARRREEPRPDAEAATDGPMPDVTGSAATMGLWGDEGPADVGETSLPSASEALDEGRAALDAGALEDAARHLALVLRLSSTLAPAVLDLIADRTDPALGFVRGDAFRLVGREVDARRAYARAVGPASSADPISSHADAAPAASSDLPSEEGDPT